MEKISPLIAGDQRVLTGIDDLLESGLSTGKVLHENERLALESPREALRDLHGTVLVGRALTLVQVGGCRLALAGDPAEQVLMRHRIIGILVGVVRQAFCEHVVDERRRVPQRGEEEVEVGAHDTGLGHAALGRRGGTAIGQTVLEVVDDQVAGVVHLEQVLVEVVDHLVAGVEAELVQLGHEVVVTEVGAGGIHVVTAVVQRGLVVRIDGTSVLTGDAGGEAGIRRVQGRDAIFVGLVEGLDGGHTLLRDIKIFLAGDARHEGSESKNRINYLFHIPYSIKS